MTQVHEQYFCKVCNTDALTNEALALIQEYIATLEPGQCVEDREYTRRLWECGRCNGIARGDTCRYCGCLVLVRAKKRSNGCPHPSGSRW